MVHPNESARPGCEGAGPTHLSLWIAQWMWRISSSSILTMDQSSSSSSSHLHERAQSMASLERHNLPAWRVSTFEFGNWKLPPS